MSDYRIHKYPLTICDEPIITMPAGSALLHVEEQGVEPPLPFLWAIVDIKKHLVQRRLRIIGTGHPMNLSDVESAQQYKVRHVGTFQQHNGRFVWHVFDMGEA